MFGKRNKFITLSWTSASSWEYKGSTYIVVANLHKTSPQHVEYEINATGTLSNFFKDRSASLSFANKQLTGIIPPKQVQVYKIN